MHRKSLAVSNQRRSGSDTRGIRLDGLERVLLGDHTSGDHSPAKVGHFCAKPLMLLIYLGGLKLPCIDSAQLQKWGWTPHSQRGQVAGGDCRQHCQGRGRYSGRENLDFGSCSQNQLN